MLQIIGESSLERLMQEVIPSDIRRDTSLNISEAVSENRYLKAIEEISERNLLHTSFIGQGYYGTITPSPLTRMIFQNPGWYTQYTPYQAEIAQGRLEALLNFQTVVADLTRLPIANASLLDEATAAAEAMFMVHAKKNKKANVNRPKIWVDKDVFKQTIEVLKTRASFKQIEVVIGDKKMPPLTDEYFAALIQYPNATGEIEHFDAWINDCRGKDIDIIVAADLLSLTLLRAPGEWGADIVVGSTQRFGVPMGYGGPHAAFFACTESYKRVIPGRIIGVSKDRAGAQALRMALQTREQHIKRERATSNICTAQALLAIMASMYAVYHGAEGLRQIAIDIAEKTNWLKERLNSLGFAIANQYAFDTLTVLPAKDQLANLNSKATESQILWFENEGRIHLSIDETHSWDDVIALSRVFGDAETQIDFAESINVPSNYLRSDSYLDHPVFQLYRTETSFMRYCKRLENKDLSLVHSMIPLGSCTMKLNAATQLIPVSWKRFSQLHPFVPSNHAAAYNKIIRELHDDLCEITEFSACSFQPNSGAQGEYTGLIVIRAYHKARGEAHRDIALIPTSAHGTNPASAVMAGMRVVLVACDDDGNIDLHDLESKIETHADRLGALMITYPSTHGVFEIEIRRICNIVHAAGGMVYMDGANMNAQVGLTSPARIGADVCHLNLHKTFAIPHGGGGPGMGPICVNEKLAAFLPGHVFGKSNDQASGAVSAAEFGSASILLISHAYIKLLGKTGLKSATQVAILNSNYIKARLENTFDVLYVGDKGYVAHELILDVRPYKSNGISAEDIAKRLIDYGFHSPTLSFPVAGTLMIEPTESEDKAELDRFCEAMLAIHSEIKEVLDGIYPLEDNVLVNAPHTASQLMIGQWDHSYTREKAAYPLPFVRDQKFWPAVQRIDNAYGDRNLQCTCPPIEEYAEVEPSISA